MTGPDTQLGIVLDVCAATGVDAYTTFCAVLTGYAESDFRVDAVQANRTFGVFQQNPRWWPGNPTDTAHQCASFLADFMSKTGEHTGRPVADCWRTQQWLAPDPRLDPAGFTASPETQNYVRRVPAVQGIIDTRRVPR